MGLKCSLKIAEEIIKSSASHLSIGASSGIVRGLDKLFFPGSCFSFIQQFITNQFSSFLFLENSLGRAIFTAWGAAEIPRFVSGFGFISVAISMDRGGVWLNWRIE